MHERCWKNTEINNQKTHERMPIHVIEKKISFYSEGYLLQGTLYLPDDLKEGEKRPAIIPNSGYNGFNQFYPRMFAKKLTQSGYICLGFDYRGFADSEGERGRAILSEHGQCMNNARACLQRQQHGAKN